MEPLPPWCARIVAAAASDDAALMRAAIAIASGSIDHGGGPFGAVIADANGRIIEAGWNDVVATHDSTAHAEIVAIRRTQAALSTHDLSTTSATRLFTSCAPCIQCFGAIYWSGLASVHAAADHQDAEAIGFSEGPVDAKLWDAAHRDKGITFTPRFGRDEAALAPLRAYAARGGEVY